MSEEHEKRTNIINKSDLARFSDDIRKFELRLLDLDYRTISVKGSCKLVRHCLGILNDRDNEFQLRALRESDIEYLHSQISHLSKLTIRAYINTFGRFLSLIIGDNLCSKVFPSSRYTDTPWYTGKMGTFHFPKELMDYQDTLQYEGMKSGSIRNRAISIKICCRILDAEKGIRRITDIDTDCIQLLKGMMTTISGETVNSYLMYLGDFVRRYSGESPYKSWLKLQSRRPYYNPTTKEGLDFKHKLDSYTEDMRIRELHQVTIDKVANCIVLCYDIITDEFGPTFLCDVDVERVRALKKALSVKKQSTVRKYLYDFGNFIQWVTDRNPVQGARFNWNEDDVDRTFIDIDEFKTVLSKADEEARLILALGTTMGLRRFEIAGIKLSDLRGRNLVIRGKGHGENGKVVEMEITKSVQDAIDDYIPIRQAILTKHGDRSEGNLLVRTTTFAGGPFTPACVDTVMQKLSEKSGISITSHVMRRLYCTSLYEAGTDLDTLRRMMRHSSLDTTMRCYLNANKKKIKSASDAVDGMLFQ